MIQKKIPVEYILILAVAFLFFMRAHYQEIDPYKVYPDLASLAPHVITDNTNPFPSIASQTLGNKNNLSTPMKIEGIPLTIKYFFLDNLLTATAFKVFGLCMYLLAILLLHILHKKIFKRPIAIAITILAAMYILTLNTFAGGNFRCLGFCFLLLFLISITYRRYIVAALIMMLTVIYPYNVPLMGMLLLIATFRDLNLSNKQKYLFVGFLGCIGIIILNLSFGGVSPIGVLTNENFHVSLDYKYKLRIEGLWNDAPILNFIKHIILNFQEHNPIYATYTVIFLILFLLSYKKHTIVKDLLLASFSSFLIISVLMNASVASRILLFAVPIILMINLGFFLQRFKLDSYAKRKILISCVILLTLPFFALYRPCLIDLKNYKNIYSYINKIDTPHVLLFGHPETMEFVPFYTHRNTFTSVKLEYTLPLKGALDYLEKRNKEIIKLLYSKNLDEVKKDLKIKAINYIILEDYFYSPGYIKSKHWTYLQYGYLKEIKKFLDENNPTKDFALYEFVKQNYDFIDKDNGLYVMAAKKLFQN